MNNKKLIQISEKSAAQNFTKSRLPEFSEAEKAYVKGSADFFGLNYYFGVLTENKPSDINVVDYYADQDIQESNDPTFYT